MMITSLIHSHRRFHTSARASLAQLGDHELFDLFGRRHSYLRISLTERCNLRCTYCMPESGVQLQPSEHLLTDDEIVRIANLFTAKGVSKIRFTGGEPLIRSSLVDICKQIQVPELAITTNGILLERNLEKLLDSGVNLLNISLDTLIPSKFELITRRRGFERVHSAILQAAKMPFQSIKVNCVVKKGVNDDEILDFVSFVQDLPIQIRFIEYMPFEGNKWNPKSMLSYTEMVDKIKSRYPDFTRSREKDGSHAVSKTWKIPGFRGSVGFISSMSDHFCSTCSRMRVTADGNLKVCLFGSEEVSLRDAIRGNKSDDEMYDIIQGALEKKHEKMGGHASPEDIAKGINRPMILIGG